MMRVVALVPLHPDGAARKPLYTSTVLKGRVVWRLFRVYDWFDYGVIDLGWENLDFEVRRLAAILYIESTRWQ